MNHFFYSACMLLFVSLTITTNSYSQKKSAARQTEDSIQKVRQQLSALKGSKGLIKDSLRLELLNVMAELYREKSKDTALQFAESALTEAKALGLKNVTAVSLFNIASIYEYHKDFLSAEENFIRWMEIRKDLSDDEYRWALNEMRRFYCITMQKEKLEKIEDEWLTVLDRQLDEKHISPWYESDNPTPEDNYKYSMEPVFQYLVNHRHYFIAEKSFLHMLKKCPSCLDGWGMGQNVYWQAHPRMLWEKDTATLVIWYKHWFDVLQQNQVDKETSLETFNHIAQQYTSRYSSYDRYFDRFYPLMMDYTQKVGGDSAVHDMLLASSRRYVGSLPIRIKLNLFLLISCIQVKDRATLEKTYTQTDKLIKDYIANGQSKPDLYMLLVTSRSKSKDKQFVKWCNKTIEHLK